MSNLYSHTYWDGMRVERFTGRARKPSYHEPAPAQIIHGPHKPLSEAMKMLAYEKSLRECAKKA